jgi:hypothetical protein
VTNYATRPRLCKNFRAFHTSLFRSLLRGLRAFRVEKIEKNLALLDRLQNLAEFLDGLDPKRTIDIGPGKRAKWKPTIPSGVGDACG